MDLVGVLVGAIAGAVISGLLLCCAFYLFMRKRGRRTANYDVEMREMEEIPLSSTIPSIGESSSPRFLVDDGMEFSYTRTRANLLGRGSFGAVYKGLCLQDQTEVAIKLVNCREYGNKRHAQKYCKREVETLKRGSRVNRNVTKFLGSVMNDPEFALVTEYCDGGNMSRWMSDTCSASETDGEYLVALFEAYVQLANGLLGLRDNRIVHRDLKASNVFITLNAMEFARGRLTLGYTFGTITSEHHHRAEVPFTVKIGDFGLARVLDDSEEMTAGVGTEGYIAPEVRRGGRYGTESDLYSLGVMLKRDLEAADFFSSIDSNGNKPTYSRTQSDSMRVILALTNADSQERPTVETLIETLTNFTFVQHTNEHTDEVTLSLYWQRDA